MLPSGANIRKNQDGIYFQYILTNNFGYCILNIIRPEAAMPPGRGRQHIFAFPALIVKEFFRQ